MSAIPLVNGTGWVASIAMTRAYLRDPLAVMREVHQRHGPVAQINLFGMPAIVLLGPEANEHVLLNREGSFSSELGWHPVIGRTFPSGLISIDGDQHRDDRRLIGAAFKPDPMRHYMERMSADIARDLSDWPERLLFYPAIKRLTLQLAATVLLGLPLGPQAEDVGRAFTEMLGASTAIVRRPVPGGALWRGIRARDRLSRFLLSQIPLRRDRPGPDIFSTICNVAGEDGRPLSGESIVNHINLLLMAAHDTTTSALTSLAYQLGRHGVWQDRLREELTVWTRQGADRPDYESLRTLTLTDMVLSETLRCMPPVPSLPRGLTRDVEFGGYRLPRGASVGIHILHTHHMENVWPQPERFDPLRFTPAMVRERHRYAWLPFGGGTHMCLGLHFASMQVKLFLAELLLHRRIVLPDGYAPHMQWLPISKPRDDLPIRLERA